MKSTSSFAILAGLSLLLGAGCFGSPVKKAVQPTGVQKNIPIGSTETTPDKAPKTNTATNTAKVSPSEGPMAKPNPDSDQPAPAKGTMPEGGGPELKNAAQ